MDTTKLWTEGRWGGDHQKHLSKTRNWSDKTLARVLNNRKRHQSQKSWSESGCVIAMRQAEVFLIRTCEVLVASQMTPAKCFSAIRKRFLSMFPFSHYQGASEKSTT